MKYIIGIVIGLLIGMNFPSAGPMVNNLIHQGGIAACESAKAPRCVDFFERTFTPVQEDVVVNTIAKPIIERVMEEGMHPQPNASQGMRPAPIARTPITQF